MLYEIVLLVLMVRDVLCLGFGVLFLFYLCIVSEIIVVFLFLWLLLIL